MRNDGTLVRPFLGLLTLSCWLCLSGTACRGKGLPGVPGAAGNGACPSFANAEAVARTDFAHEFKLKADVAHKLKAGVEAAVELKALADRIDADLKLGCGDLARDLGKSEKFENGGAAPPSPPWTKRARSSAHRRTWCSRRARPIARHRWTRWSIARRTATRA